MTTLARGLRLSLAALALLALPALAQHPQVRQGFWFNAGLGYGSLGCEDCDDREGGVSGALAVGGTLAGGKLYLGAGTNGWTKKNDDLDLRLNVGTLTALIRWYPSATGGFFLLGGLGVGSIKLSRNNVSVEQTGGAAIIGLGYDFRVGKNVSLTPFWNGYGVHIDDVDANVGQIGLGLTVH